MKDAEEGEERALPALKIGADRGQILAVPVKLKTRSETI